MNSRTDLLDYLTDVRGDIADLGEEYLHAIADQLQASDHPGWGNDWTEWLEEVLDEEFVETVVHGVDALRGVQ